MVPEDWDSAPSCVCGPNLTSDLIGESPIFSAASIAYSLTPVAGRGERQTQEEVDVIGAQLCSCARAIFS